MIYFLLITLPVLIGCFSFIHQGKLFFGSNQKLFLILFLILCTLIMGFRNEYVGIDTWHYSILYSDVASASLHEICQGWTFNDLEIGYCLFMKACSVFSGNYYFFQIIYSCVFSILSYYFLKENCKNYFLVYPIYLECYLMAFNIQRQMLAVLIAANAWTFIKKQNYIKAFLTILVAVTIHTTAAIFFVAILSVIVRKHPEIIRIIPILIIIVTVNYKYVIEFLQSHVGMYGNYYNNSKAIMTAGISKIMWAVIIIISTLSIYFIKHIDVKNDIKINGIYKRNVFDNDYAVNGMMIAVFSMIYISCNIVGLSFNYVERIGLYFMPFILPMLENFSSYFENVFVKRFYCISLWICYYIYFLLGVQSPQYDYSFFFWS